MSRNTKSEIWQYFEYVNVDSAKCNQCGKLYSRKGRTTTSLKSHLKSSHPQEFSDFLTKDTARLENKTGLKSYDLLKAKPVDKQHPVLIKENPTTPTSTSGVNEKLFESNELKKKFYINERTLESNESYATDIITLSPTIIKQEVFIEPEDLLSAILPETITEDNAITKERQKIFYEERNGKRKSSLRQDPTSQTIDDPDDPLEVPICNIVLKEENEEYVEQLPQMDSSDDYFNEQAAYNFEATQHEQSTTDPEGSKDKSSVPPKENFESWFKKRKQILEIEYQEMINYEMKLNIWEREQQLKLPCSKFTKKFGI